MNLVLNAPPDLRSDEIALLKAALMEKKLRIAELEEELSRVRARSASSEQGIRELQVILGPLYQALQMIYGQIEATGIPGNGPVPIHDETRRVWDSWKQKLGGLTAKAIDVLLLHGPMNQTQLRIQLHCASRSVTNIVGALNKAGLINKADGKISLKDLYR